MFDIVVGRSKSNVEKYGLKGTVLLAKHYVKMGQVTTLSNKIHLDVSTSHVIFVVGKRGSGKSYTLGSISEGLAGLNLEYKKRLSFILIDTMGIYWTMKYPNRQDEELLKEWDLESRSYDVKIFTPFGYYTEYKKKGIPTDVPFAIKPNELTFDDWLKTFKIDEFSEVGSYLVKIITDISEKMDNYDIKDILNFIKEDEQGEKKTKDIIYNFFRETLSWGLFSKEGTEISNLATGGQVSILDVSCYVTVPNGWKIKSLVVGLVSQKLFNKRMIARKNEEYASINKALHYFAQDEEEKLELPLVWLIIDEAHEFLPHDGITAASQPLITILREGRQPGISLILATQQPGKIHTDVMTQSDIVLAHRVTAKLDTDALENLTQSYMRGNLITNMDRLPRIKGSAIILDDENEKLFPVRIKPRNSWHGGSSPKIFPPESKITKF